MNEENLLTYNTKQVRIPILLYIFCSWIVFIIWIYYRKGFEYGFSIEKIDQDFILFQIVFIQLSTSITRHFRKDRTGENLILNYKKEIKRSVNFSFSTDNNFEKIVKKFIEDFELSGIKIYRVDNSKEDIDSYKYLKKGEFKNFDEHSMMEKVSNIVEHNYIYHNLDPLIFGIHVHLKFAEELRPIDKDLILYLFDGGKIEKIEIKVGETYIIPKCKRHAVIFTESNRVGLKWK
tara:strand:+ start:24506 stop:25207 length:702 start_codon:yes stop_codon:yes gene_type:complete